MKLERIPYAEKKNTTVEQIQTIGGQIIEVPRFDYPIDPRENFRRVLERDLPMWVPTAATDFNYTLGGTLTGLADLRFDFKDRCDWTDMFGCVWEWIPEAGGSMLKPGAKPVIEDITRWKEEIVWPELNEKQIKQCCESYMNQSYYHPERMNYFDFGQGCTERLVAVLGGYQEAMIAFAEEPEACKDFMTQLSYFHCEMLDKILKYFPADLIMYHDDWGTERDTFFSSEMMENIVYEPNEIFFRHTQKRGVKMVFHCCGNIKRFVPYMIELGPDFLQLQARANDLCSFKKQFGHRLGFDAVIRGTTEAETAASMHKQVDELAKDGGMMSTVFAIGEDALWGGLQELYCYSRGYYSESLELPV